MTTKFQAQVTPFKKRKHTVGAGERERGRKILMKITRTLKSQASVATSKATHFIETEPIIKKAK